MYTALWISWVLLFAVVEAFALINKSPGDTLSEHVRKWFGVKTKLGRATFLVVFGGFVAWFSVHIITGLV